MPKPAVRPAAECGRRRQKMPKLAAVAAAARMISLKSVQAAADCGARLAAGSWN
jgi:hypothetical protein